METQSLLGVGLYSIPEAAQLLGIPPARLRRWAEGYAFKSKGKELFSAPLLRRQLSIAEGETVLTFQDLIELHFYNLFHNEGVSWPTIRATAERAARLFQTDHPFAIRRLRTDGKGIFAEMTPADVEDAPHERVLQDLALGQTIISVIAEPFFRKLDYDADEVQRWWPLGKKRCVVLDAHRAFGKPIDEATGVPTHALYRMVRGGESLERVASWYGVDQEAVLDAIEFESNRPRKAA